MSYASNGGIPDDSEFPSQQYRQPSSRPRITVIGVGGAGGNAVNNMIARTSKAWSSSSPTPTPRQWPSRAGRAAHPARAAPPRAWAPGRARYRPCRRRGDARRDHGQQLEGRNMVFITAGMGGGTGTGAAPVIARAAREHGILTVGVVTKPFHFEGAHRMKLAEQGIEELSAICRHADHHPEPESVPGRQRTTTFADAFKMADDVLHAGRARRHRSDGHARPDQSRLRRYPHGDERDGQGDDGHRRGRGRGPRDRAPPKPRSPIRCSTT